MYLIFRETLTNWSPKLRRPFSIVPLGIALGYNTEEAVELRENQLVWCRLPEDYMPQPMRLLMLRVSALFYQLQVDNSVIRWQEN